MINVKKFISIIIALTMIFALCSCGSVDIGPLTFNFGNRTPSGYNPNWSGSANATDASAEEIVPIDAPEAMYENYGNFSFNIRTVVCGYFSDRGYNRDMAFDPLSPYLFIVFDYEEHDYHSESHRTYVEYVDFEGIGAFPQVVPSANPDHFVNNIDRYFGFNSSAEHETLAPGTSDLMFACFRITDEAFYYLQSGGEFSIKVGESYPSIVGAAEIMLIDELLGVYMDYGHSYEAAHAAATFLWSTDFAMYTAITLSDRAAEYGDPWIFGTDIDHLPNLYFGGASASAAVTPDFNGEFYLNVGAPEFYPELVLEVYPELDGIMWEFMDYCNMMCNYALEGNIDGLYECRDILRELYQVICAVIGLDPLYY